MSLAKLTSLSTQTLSLLLERQRLQSLPSFNGKPTANSSSLHLPQITRNLKQLRTGILDLEAKDGRTEAVVLMRSQFERMRGMLGADAGTAGIPSFDESKDSGQEAQEGDAASGSGSDGASGSSTPPFQSTARSAKQEWPRPESTEPMYTPYTDDPEAGLAPSIMLQEQRRLMDNQDAHLDNLSHSINRQRDLSLQINDELEVHTGLLEGLDVDLDNTSGRLNNARRQLNRVAKGAKEHGAYGCLCDCFSVLILTFRLVHRVNHDYRPAHPHPFGLDYRLQDIAPPSIPHDHERDLHSLLFCHHHLPLPWKFSRRSPLYSTRRTG
ncbi:hypothetical protein BV25DRAFT_1733812 [Artomyces pyxidatus]|uniref:Uncharacterized protein n=1 Tax=Artomyces pyxidatus TaxID=48021 RepID=A0ACB8SHK4_9AGAM|nr:hypothetical protein BV25DRAFT_1733812 [Artomyces pyxidatus]